jgi:hypothetical protein
MEWKVIEEKGGSVSAFTGYAALFRPLGEERLIWQGDARDNREALQKAKQVEPKLDLLALRIR